MKHSMKKIFQNLNAFMLFVVFVSFLFMTLTLEKQLSFEKVDNLNNQKKIISSLIKLKKDDIELALIQFNGKSAQLQNEIEKLRNIYKYSITEKYILQNEREYLNSLKELSLLTDTFTKSAQKYFDETTSKKQEQKAQLELKRAFFQLKNKINSIILKNIEYEKARFNIFKYLAIASFVITFFATFWYRKRINNIYKDIEFLFSMDKQKDPYDIFTQEADGIALRMKRKNVTTQTNPLFIDQVTGINNHKGLMNAYANKKGLKESFFTSVTVIEIDNFSKSHRPFTQELTQAILKKIAFTISLHEQPTDVIARTDYNQFTIVLSRATKEQAFRDMDIIRQSISELKFNTPTNENITITGGFIIKPNNASLEEAIRQAKENLAHKPKIGNNKIIQTKDIAKNQ